MPLLRRKQSPIPEGVAGPLLQGHDIGRTAQAHAERWGGGAANGQTVCTPRDRT